MRDADILLVEDERIVALHLSQQLLKLGYRVSGVVASGEAALAKATELHPSVILMDINIEGEFDGIEAASRLPDDVDASVIYLTAYAEDSTLERARATKPYGYLLKPFSERELHATIQMALERRDADTRMRETQAALHRSREEFRYLFRNNPLPMWAFSTATLKFLEVNDAAIAGYGYSREEFLAMDITQIGPPEERKRLETMLELGLKEYERSENWRHLHRDGHPIETDIFSHAILFDGQQARLIVAIDVTDRKAAEAQLRQAQKLQAVGQLTGGIAHDFNNLLAIIQGNLELVGDRLGNDALAAEFLDDAFGATYRAASLTRRLLAYARKQPLAPRVVDLARLVPDMVTLLRRTLPEAIEIRAEMPPGLWPTRIDAHQLENSLLNLAVNGRDAMPGGGTLTIAAENLELDADFAEGQSELKPGAFVRLAVSDTGSGMAREVLEQALEPFFTTKPAGLGGGLGLSMVYGFVKQSGGHLAIASEPGRGTTVSLYFPRAEPEAADADPLAGRPPIPRAGPGEVILVVEDDPGVLKLTLSRLGRLGYITLSAPDGPSALALLDTAARVDLLLTDISLPNGLNGFALFEAASRRRAGLKALFMSGYAATSIGSELPAGTPFLTKPFPQSELAGKLRQLLDERPGERQR
jgi:PAS domain S-box-containing protein